MKKIIFSLAMIFGILIIPASADLFGDMYQKIPVYNQNADKVPGVIKSLLGNEEMYGIIDLNDGTKLEVKAVTKAARVIQFAKVGTKITPGKGDCNKDAEISAVDALCALKMSVGKMPEDENMDVDGDLKVTSSDVRIILQGAVKLSTEANPILVVTTNEKTIRSIMDSSKPADTFLNAYDNKDITIEAKGIVKSIVFSLGMVIIKIAKFLGIV
jgi:hypothetical protein